MESELLHEAEEESADKASTGKPASEEDAVLVEPGTPSAPAPAETSTLAGTPAKAPAPSTPASAAGTPGTPSSKKKKASKK